MSITKIGVVGAGGISKAHLAAAANLPDRVKVVAVADPNAEAAKAAAEQAGAECFPDAAAMLDQGGLDGVVVCTPPSVREAIVADALGRGVGVLAEKPLAHDVATARRLRDAAASAGVPAFVGYCHRFTPAVVEMKRRLAVGDLGDLVRFENTFACDFPALRDRWMSDPAVSGGGSFLDTGCHSLDLLRFVVPGPASVAGSVLRHGWPGRGESNATVLLALGHDAAGVIQSGWAEAERFTVGLVGTAATLSYDYVAHPTELVRRGVDGSCERIEVETHEVRFDRQLAAFADALGGAGTDLCTFAEAAEVNELAHAATRQ